MSFDVIELTAKNTRAPHPKLAYAFLHLLFTGLLLLRGSLMDLLKVQQYKPYLTLTTKGYDVIRKEAKVVFVLVTTCLASQILIGVLKLLFRRSGSRKTSLFRSERSGMAYLEYKYCHGREPLNDVVHGHIQRLQANEGKCCRNKRQESKVALPDIRFIKHVQAVPLTSKTPEAAYFWAGWENSTIQRSPVDAVYMMVMKMNCLQAVQERVENNG